MEHESSTAKIYWTKDYGKFHFLHGNRDLNPTKIKKLIKDVESGLSLFQYCPILVNETMHIIDGQHRFYVCKKLKLNVYYIIVPDFSLAQIAKVNNNQNRWKMQDFLNCYIDAGLNSEHYITLKLFKDAYGITISLAVSLLSQGTSRAETSCLEDFRNGNFKVKQEIKAKKLLDAAREYAPYSDITKSRDFISALEKLLSNGKFSHKAMIQKLEKNNLRIEKRSNSKEYLQHMEELFNFKNSKRQTIY